MKLAIASVILVGACAHGPAMQRVELVNKTTRSIDEIYVFPVGAANHGAPRGVLAPSATKELQIPAGNIEVDAVSGHMQIDEHTRDRPSASTSIELKEPAKVIFYDDDAKPAGIDAPNTYGVKFHVPKGQKPPESPADQ